MDTIWKLKSSLSNREKTEKMGQKIHLSEEQRKKHAHFFEARDIVYKEFLSQG